MTHVRRMSLSNNWRHFHVMVAVVVTRAFLYSASFVDTYDGDDDKEDKWNPESNDDSDDRRDVALVGLIANTGVQQRSDVSDDHLYSLQSVTCVTLSFIAGHLNYRPPRRQLKRYFDDTDF